MTNRGDVQKIGERHPPRQDWQTGAGWRAEPDGSLLVLVIPMLGFALAIMLVLSFAIVLHGAAPGIPLQGHRILAAHPAAADHMAVFVL